MNFLVVSYQNCGLLLAPHMCQSFSSRHLWLSFQHSTEADHTKRWFLFWFWCTEGLVAYNHPYAIYTVYSRHKSSHVTHFHNSKWLIGEVLWLIDILGTWPTQNVLIGSVLIKLSVWNVDTINENVKQAGMDTEIGRWKAFSLMLLDLHAPWFLPFSDWNLLRLWFGTQCGDLHCLDRCLCSCWKCTKVRGDSKTHDEHLGWVWDE